MDLESTEPKDRINRMVEAAKENHKDSQIIFKEWCNATKMRKWLRDKIAALWSVKEEERLSGDQIEAKKQESVQQIVKKAEFLIKLQKPHVFKSANPNEELFEMSFKVPSYARD